MKQLMLILILSALLVSCKKECYTCHAKCYGGGYVFNGDTLRDVCDKDQIDYLKSHNAVDVNGAGCPWTCTLK